MHIAGTGAFTGLLRTCRQVGAGSGSVGDGAMVGPYTDFCAALMP